MLRLENLSKSFWYRGVRRTIISNLNLTLPEGRSLALLGGNGAGKTTLLEIIAGVQQPDTGRVVTDGAVSWPVGFSGSFNSDMTGAQNTIFVARVYGVDTASLLRFVLDFSELGAQFDAPVRTYSSGMKARLSFGLSMGIQFDTYLVDETTAVGDASFNRKSKAVFRERIRNASAIMVSHQTRKVKDYCDAALVLHQGRLEYYDDLDEGVARHKALMGEE
ncbi:ABC transporter ATP-binding protein [uncultured Jannaschia sp.]|uniref:ABC transporter ATP-binding protein n=1 Tax=uncultured Jannaschia sp. TaxID=293347 RepID=UPI002606331F|nr:ABC transporter ATP-binding protein [uncultured Jannaschia sp.]